MALGGVQVRAEDSPSSSLMSYRRPPAGWRPTRSLSPTQTHIHIYTCIQWDIWVNIRTNVQSHHALSCAHDAFQYGIDTQSGEINVVPEVGR